MGSGPHPPKNTKLYGSLAILVQIPWKITKLQCLTIIDLAAKRQMVIGSSLSPLQLKHVRVELLPLLQNFRGPCMMPIDLNIADSSTQLLVSTYVAFLLYISSF